VRIVDHWLELEPGDPYVLTRKPADGWAGKALIVPFLLLAHYAVSESLDVTVAAQDHRDFFAHLSTDEFDGGARGPVLKIVQTLPFNRRGSHAGPSRWTDKSGHVWDGVNACSVGVEIANWGPLKRHPDGSFTVRDTKIQWPSDQVVTAEHSLKTCSFQHWCAFSDAETDFMVQLGLLLRKHYPLEDILGHSDVATPVGRKIDPGPAFPLQATRDAIFRDPLSQLLNESAA
jgi:N-acetyl-anhydromuramyl-L-alanine amidase AmpD